MWKPLLLLSTLVLASGVRATTTLRRLVTYYPYPEPDFDYVDHDLDHVPGATFDDCKQKCIDYTGCTAYSWSNFGTGMCWLKSARDQVVYKPGVTSSVLWTDDQSSKVCQPRYDLDYVDHDLTSYPGQPFSACCDLCHHYAGCRAYSWNSDNGGTCWLKSARDKVIYKPGVISADAYPTGIVDPSVQFDTDYVDHDIGNKHSDAYGGCFGLCASTPGCHAFSWSDFAGGTCWLKAMKEKTEGKTGVVSAVVSVAVDNCVWETEGNDYVDNDIGYTPGIPNWKDCCKICKGTTNCKAFAWSDYQGGTCWLKSSKGGLVAKAGVRAAWVP